MPEKTILVAEDNDEWRSLIVMWLEDEGFKVQIAPDAKSVMKLSERTPPDCFVLDYDLGDGTAEDLIPSLRARFPDKPLIVLTSLAVKMLDFPEERRPEQFIVKSGEPFELLSVLRRLLKI